jgi:hypothetical protein
LIRPVPVIKHKFVRAGTVCISKNHVVNIKYNTSGTGQR